MVPPPLSSELERIEQGVGDPVGVVSRKGKDIQTMPLGMCMANLTFNSTFLLLESTVHVAWFAIVSMNVSWTWIRFCLPANITAQNGTTKPTATLVTYTSLNTPIFRGAS